MATITYGIFSPNGGDWNGSFTVNTPSNPIATELPTSTSTSAINFNVAQFAVFDEYATWRSVNISSQPSGPPNYLNIYPTSGYSIDIWCPQLITDIKANRTWNYIAGRMYLLNSDKNTLIYDYSSSRAIHNVLGGTISFQIS